MYESEVFRQEITSLKAMIEETGKSLDIEHLKEQLIEYQEDMASPGFWDDVERAQKVNQKMRSCENRINHYKSLQSRADDVEVMMELAEEEGGDEMAGEIGEELKKLREELEALKLTTPKEMSLEQCLDFIDTDELLEITPTSLRIRKKILDPTMRKRSAMNKKSQM